jgi:hypothetical protein
LYLWLDRRWESESDVQVITSQGEQYGVTVHLFIGTGRSLGKITFMSLTLTIDYGVISRGLGSIFPFRSVPFSITALALGRSFFIRSFGVDSSFSWIAPFMSCTPSSQSRRFLWQYIIHGKHVSRVFEDLRKTKAPNRHSSSCHTCLLVILPKVFLLRGPSTEKKAPNSARSTRERESQTIFYRFGPLWGA